MWKLIKRWLRRWASQGEDAFAATSGKRWKFIGFTSSGTGLVELVRLSPDGYIQVTIDGKVYKLATRE